MDKLPSPVICGWARTQSEQHQPWNRSYLALFHGIGIEEEDVLHFFINPSQCKKMIDQRLRTSHHCVPLFDVTRLQLRLEDIDGGERVIALQTGIGKGARETAIVLEEQKDVTLWMRHIKDWCPSNAHHTAADGTPMPSSIGETAFPSVNTVDSGMNSFLPSLGGHLDDDIGRAHQPVDADEVFVAAAASTERGDGGEGACPAAAGPGMRGNTHTRTQSDVGTSQQQGLLLSMQCLDTETGVKGEADVTELMTPRGTGPDAAGGIGGGLEHSSPMTDVE